MLAYWATNTSDTGLQIYEDQYTSDKYIPGARVTAKYT